MNRYDLKCVAVPVILTVITGNAVSKDARIVIMVSILSGYLIQCNDEPRTPINDCESGSKWPQEDSSIKGTCRHRKSASEEALT